MFNIASLNSQYNSEINDIIQHKTKPPGALGLLENCAAQLASIYSQKQQKLVTKISIIKPSMLVFAGDHGIAQHPISIAPSAVTRQMVLNFMAGGAAVNCFCRTNEIAFKVIDAGIIEPLSIDETRHCDAFIEQRLGAGTADFSTQAAMTESQVEQGLKLGSQIAQQTIDEGCNLLMLGEMGIGNTSAAAAILVALTGQSVDECVGQGTGIDRQQLALKKSLIQTGIDRLHCSSTPLSTQQIIAEFAGFEIVQMVGAICAAAQAGIPVLVDGFIVTSAVLLACKLHPQVRDYLIFAHQSNEKAHLLMLSILSAEPLLHLGLRLGEGTGAALALPLLKSAASFYNDMASFDSAGVTV
ncbi:nicotinate-nucleotide--dimethylbenzimidazole phosphoribosyltransferase [Colwelliaceae bacterium 6441]